MGMALTSSTKVSTGSAPSAPEALPGVAPRTYHLLEQQRVAFPEEHAEVQDLGDVEQEVVVENFSKRRRGKEVILRVAQREAGASVWQHPLPCEPGLTLSLTANSDRVADAGSARQRERDRHGRV